jgi:hypothetical protein
MRDAQKGGLPPARPWHAKTRPCPRQGRTRYPLCFTSLFGCRYGHPEAKNEKKSLSIDRSLGERGNVIKWTG